MGFVISNWHRVNIKRERQVVEKLQEIACKLHVKNLLWFDWLQFFIFSSDLNYFPLNLIAKTCWISLEMSTKYWKLFRKLHQHCRNSVLPWCTPQQQARVETPHQFPAYCSTLTDRAIKMFAFPPPVQLLNLFMALAWCFEIKRPGKNDPEGVWV